MKKTMLSFVCLLSSAFLISTSVAVAEVNTSMGSTVGVPFDTCKPEKGVKFRGTNETKITSEQMEEILIGNTLLSVDRYGTFAIYYPEQGKSVGWMPKLKNKGYEWSAGDVNFANNKYCRTWIKYRRE